jgi:hypothetical protein
MRILKLELPGTLHARSPEIQIDDPAVHSRLFQELDKVSGDLADRIRAKAATYLPRGYTLFSRVGFDARGNRVLVTLWIDDPSVTGLAGLLARRAWKLSVPIMAHIVREAAQERLQTIAIEIDEARTQVSSYAPSRAWRNPVVVAVATLVVVSFYWLALHGLVAGAMRRMFGL